MVGEKVYIVKIMKTVTIAVHPDDYSVQRTQELRGKFKPTDQVPGDDLPFEIP